MARRKGSNHVTQTCSLCLSHLGCVCQALLSRFTLWHLEQQYNFPVQAQQETAGVFSPVLQKSWISCCPVLDHLEPVPGSRDISFPTPGRVGPPLSRCEKRVAAQLNRGTGAGRHIARSWIPPSMPWETLLPTTSPARRRRSAGLWNSSASASYSRLPVCRSERLQGLFLFYSTHLSEIHTLVWKSTQEETKEEMIRSWYHYGGFIARLGLEPFKIDK